MLLEDGAAAGVCFSGGPVHGHPDPEGLAVWTLSRSLPLPDQTPQRYASTASHTPQGEQSVCVQLQNIIYKVCVCVCVVINRHTCNTFYLSGFGEMLPSIKEGRSLNEGIPKKCAGQRNEICVIRFTIILKFISIKSLSQRSCSSPPPPPSPSSSCTQK